MEKVIYNLVFNRKKQLNPTGEALIQVEAYYNKKKKYFSTKVYVQPSQWDNKRKFIKNHPNMDALNQKIRSFITDMEHTELQIWQSKNQFTLDDLKNTGHKYNTTSFLSFYQNELTATGLKKSTKCNHLSTLTLVSAYKSDLSFDDFSFEFLCGFENYLLAKGYHRNTIAKHMKHLKRYINLAINKDLFDLQKYPFRKFKIKYSETHRNHLTPDELKKFENVDLKSMHKRYRKTLDAFLFSCYTGLRFSDIIKLTPENIFMINNQTWLVFSSVKTDTEIKLPLFLLFDGKSLPILKRNTDHNNPFFLLPDNSNVNKQLKKICGKAGVNKNISFHCARHTNATLLLYNGANITTVQKLLGHKSVKTTQIYSNIMDMTIVRDLENIKKHSRHI